jgi:Zn-dependent peptidase ImmA (M78 family)
MSQPLAEGCDEDSLNHLTLVLDRLANHFGVSFRHAAMRALGLGMMSQEQWTALQDLAQSEAVHQALTRE